MARMTGQHVKDVHTNRISCCSHAELRCLSNREVKIERGALAWTTRLHWLAMSSGILLDSLGISDIDSLQGCTLAQKDNSSISAERLLHAAL